MPLEQGCKPRATGIQGRLANVYRQMEGQDAASVPSLLRGQLGVESGCRTDALLRLSANTAHLLPDCLTSELSSPRLVMKKISFHPSFRMTS